MLWVYGHYIFFISFSVAAVFGRQILTSKNGPRVERFNPQHISMDSRTSLSARGGLITAFSSPGEPPGTMITATSHTPASTWNYPSLSSEN